MVNDVSLLHELLVESAKFAPDTKVAKCGDVSISYRTLDHLSDQLSYALLAIDNGVLNRVCIYLDKSIEYLIAIFGILKAGAVYVPLDTSSPPNRLVSIINDCNPKVIITSSKKVTQIPECALSGCNVVLIDESNYKIQHIDYNCKIITWLDVLKCKAMGVLYNVTETDPAYILYTSGSTGMPKGVVISHRAALVFVNWTYKMFQISSSDIVANHAPLNFDLSIFDIFTTIKAGGMIFLVPTSITIFPKNLVNLITEQKITVWYSVPSILIKMILYGEIEKAKLSNIKLLLFAGEVLPVKYLRNLFELMPRATFYNLYGPTETNVCTYYKVEKGTGLKLPIGIACEYNKLFLLKKDKFLPVPNLCKDIGDSDEIKGELCVSGPNVMLGYWKRDNTSLVTLQNESITQKIYRTGDIVRYSSDGHLYYIGRVDNMVKSRGYRIELEEIENILYHYPMLDRAAVIAVPDVESTNLIYAFVVLSNYVLDHDKKSQEKNIKHFCSEYLPKYMVPTDVIICQELPETVNGKVDKVKLKNKFIG